MIVPALLTDSKDKLRDMLNICNGFTDFVQVDIMDGKFVPSSSITLEEVRELNSPLGCEAHLMVTEPLPWIKAFKEFGAKGIIYHFEINADHRQIISFIRANGMQAGLAVNPDTRLDEFNHLSEYVDTVLFMSVVPGFYGAKFIPAVLDKIREFRQKNPKKRIGIDGGVKLDNVAEVKKSGVDTVCVGSAILEAPDPARAYEEFKKISV